MKMMLQPYPCTRFILLELAAIESLQVGQACNSPATVAHEAAGSDQERHLQRGEQRSRKERAMDRSLSTRFLSTAGRSADRVLRRDGVSAKDPVQHSIDDDSRDGHIEPDGKGPYRPLPVRRSAVAPTQINRNRRQKRHGRRQHDVRGQDRHNTPCESPLAATWETVWWGRGSGRSGS